MASVPPVEPPEDDELPGLEVLPAVELVWPPDEPLEPPPPEDCELLLELDGLDEPVDPEEPEDPELDDCEPDEDDCEPDEDDCEPDEEPELPLEPDVGIELELLEEGIDMLMFAQPLAAASTATMARVRQGLRCM